MLKWIRKRTRRISASSAAEPSCLSANRGESSMNNSTQYLKDLADTIQSWTESTGERTKIICPVCRNEQKGSPGDSSCTCSYTDVVSVNDKQNINERQLKDSSLYRSRSDVSDLKLTRLAKRLSPRSRQPIVDPSDFAELSSGDESSGYGESEYSATTSFSGYSSDDSAVNQLINLTIKPKNRGFANSPTLTPVQSPLPKMGCRIIQRSASAHGRSDMPRRSILRASSVNRYTKPSCGVRRSRSRATSFRKERKVDFDITSKKDNSKDNDDNICDNYLNDHIKQLSIIRTELQNLYSLNQTDK
ncbi:hypothetical protein SNE40_016539 [Patella caerulea]|uniref:Uncharacterized protein n=1 Tax=Patella caerulea TaxID=87958 RepID=A0AAN8J8W5_PATCE